MRDPLRPCPGCARHVRAESLRCPFCETALSPEVTRAPVTLPHASRAVILATLALGGCDTVVGTAHAEGTEPVSMAPQYGAPVGWDRDPPLPQPPPSTDGGVTAPADASLPRRPGRS